MARTTFNTAFYIRRNRLSKSGDTPILLRVTVNGTRAVFTTPLKVKPDQWSSTLGIATGKDRASKEVNHHLDVIKVKIMQLHKDMELAGEPFSADDVIARYTGKDIKPKIMLIEVFQEHNDKCEKLEGKDFASGTVERYRTSLKHTVEFMEHTYGKSDIPIEEVNHKFITDYEDYLKIVRNCAHNTTTKYLKNFKKIIRIALANDYIQKDPFANIKFSLNKVEKEFLTENELKIIIQKEFSIERLAQIRDFFIFSCFTGLAFSDLQGLRKEHIVIDNDGRPWIRKQRQKTKVMCNIPLLKASVDLIERYKDHPVCSTSDRVMPIISNTKMNAYLKEIMDVCGIDKVVSTHTARHSFATMMLSKGVSIENVAKMLGHTDTKMTRHYARILDKDIMNDMLNVEAKFDF